MGTKPSVSIGSAYRCYVNIYEFPVGKSHEKATQTGSITVVGHRYGEVREVVEQALRDAFDSAPAETRNQTQRG